MPSSSSPFISICIPAYKRTHYLKRLLHSVEQQTFKHFEVILSDDSDDDSVELLAKQYQDKFALRYYKNQPALGTPANWNYGISKAGGEWVKLVHDDDWFAMPTALQTFADAAKEGNRFIISGYHNVNDEGTILRKPSFSLFRQKMVVKTPMVLLSENYIGQPSVVMVHRSVAARYDERMKWRVDIDYYIQLLLSEKKFTLIPGVLICLGISHSQVTNSCLNVPEVELPEGLLLLEKYGTISLRNILVYDAWWRIIRNTKTRRKSDLYRFASPWPRVIERIVEQQNKTKPSVLKNGFVSKFLMLKSYLTNRKDFFGIR